MHQATTPPKIAVDRRCATRMHPSPIIPQIKRFVVKLDQFVQERCTRKWVQDTGYHLGRWKDLPIYISHYQESKQFKALALAQLRLFGDWLCYLNYQQQHFLFSNQTMTACHGSHRIQSSSTYRR
jgi:hypothetical protein